MFSDQPVQNEEKIFGGRYSNIKIECDPPQKVGLSCATAANVVHTLSRYQRVIYTHALHPLFVYTPLP
jgi:hypothetical protein